MRPPPGGLPVLDRGTLLSQRYRIRGVLGQGGMGAVYLADAEALGGKKVAVKEMVPWGLPPGELDQAVAQFKKEAAFLAGLEHPNVVRVTDFFVEEGKHYLVMDYIQGETLQEKMTGRGRPFHWYELCCWVESLMDVLEYLHNQSPPIIFRDLKPSNIMISSDGRLNLIDFGIARSACQGEKTTTFLRGTGTRGFSPIEQYGNQQSTDQRSDIYALGATLYYLMTATLPPDAVERVSRRAVVVPLSQRCPDSPPELDFVVEKAMALAAEDRYQSIGELRVALHPRPLLWKSASETQFPVEKHTELPRVVIRSSGRERSSWRGWVSAAGCLLVTGALLMSFSLHSQAADLHGVARQIEVGNPSAGLAATFDSPPKKQEELNPKLPSPKLSAPDSEPLPETQEKKLATSEPPVQKAAAKRSVNATLALDAYPKARVSTVAPEPEKETILIEEPIVAATGVADEPVKKVREQEPTLPTGPDQTGPSEPVVQAPIYVMPPEVSQVGIQSGSSASTVYQTSTQWASRGQTVDPTQAAPPGGPSLTNVPVATSFPPGLADNGPGDVALSTAPVEMSKKGGGKDKSGSNDSKSPAPSKAQAKKNDSKTVASNSSPGTGGGKKAGGQPYPKGDEGGAKGSAGNPPPPPKGKGGGR